MREPAIDVIIEHTTPMLMHDAASGRYIAHPVLMQPL